MVGFQHFCQVSKTFRDEQVKLPVLVNIRKYFFILSQILPLLFLAPPPAQLFLVGEGGVRKLQSSIPSILSKNICMSSFAIWILCHVKCLAHVSVSRQSRGRCRRFQHWQREDNRCQFLGAKVLGGTFFCCELQPPHSECLLCAVPPRHERGALTVMAATGASGVGLSLACYIFSEKWILCKQLPEKDLEDEWPPRQ